MDKTDNTPWQWGYEPSIDQRPMLTRTWNGHPQEVTGFPGFYMCSGVCVPDAIEFWERDYAEMMRYMDRCVTPKRRAPFALEEYRAEAQEQHMEASDEAIAKAQQDACIYGQWSHPGVADAGGKS